MYQSTRSVIADLLEGLGHAEPYSFASNGNARRHQLIGSAETLRYTDGLNFDPTDEEIELEEALGKIDDIDAVLDELDAKTLTPFAAIKRLREIMSHGG